jgi:hypothetical protein
MRVRLLCLFCLLLVLPKFASADTIYTYTGNHFTVVSNNTVTYTTSDSITGSFDLSSPLAANFVGSISPTSFSFSDGINTINTGNFSDVFQVTTDAAGKINSWDIVLYFFPTINSFPEDRILTENNGLGSAFDEGLVQTSPTVAGSIGENSGAPGTWTSQTLTAGATPEPSGLVLLGTGMVSVWGAARWRLRRQEPQWD